MSHHAVTRSWHFVRWGDFYFRNCWDLDSLPQGDEPLDLHHHGGGDTLLAVEDHCLGPSTMLSLHHHGGEMLLSNKYSARRLQVDVHVLQVGDGDTGGDPDQVHLCVRGDLVLGEEALYWAFSGTRHTHDMMLHYLKISCPNSTISCLFSPKSWPTGTDLSIVSLSSFSQFNFTFTTNFL